MTQQKKPSSPQQPNPRVTTISVILFLVVAFFVGQQFMVMSNASSTPTDSLITSEFTQAVEQDRVTKVVYSAGDYKVTGTYYPAITAGSNAADAFNKAFDAMNARMATKKTPAGGVPAGVGTTSIESSVLGSERGYSSTFVGQDALAALLKDHPDVSYQVTLPSEWLGILSTLLPILLIGALLFFFFNQMQKANNSQMSFGKAKTKKNAEERPDVKFSDVAGVDEAVEEMQEIKDFLSNPAKYQSMGAKVPRGCLLVGPPGTGKTLLARAVAGEAGVPFFSISGSDFVEMFVGVGASRVRDLFAKAKEQAPSIIFIDEIDALNQLLVEMDGFEEHQSVILMAATNRPDVLDPALLRPGRFDRQVTVDRPDVKGREAILGIHARNKPLSTDVDLARVAQLTPGFSGADLGNLMNESALLAARRGHERIGMDEITESMERCIAGPARKSRVMTDTERKTIAYHESGHALVGHMLANADPVKKISIIPRGQALGYTLSMPDEDHFLQTRNSMLDSLAMMLGGRTAEELFCDDITTGASNDIERATKVARSMVVSYGMCEELGPQMYGEPNHEVFLGRDIATQGNYSPETAHRIDLEVSRLIKEAHERARKVLSENAEQMHLMATVLLERETVDGDACQALLDNRWQEYLAGEAEQKAKVAAADAAKTAEERAAKEAENQLPEAESVVKVDSCDAEVRTNADGSTTVVYDGHAQTLPPVEGESKDDAEAGEKKGE